MGESGISLRSSRHMLDNSFTRTAYLLEHDWYKHELPPKLHVRAGELGLTMVLAKMRYNLAPRVYQVNTIDAIETLVRDLLADPCACAASVQNLPTEECPRLIVDYGPTRQHRPSNEQELHLRHAYAFAALEAFIRNMTGAHA